ncbi:response regulator transcription factor [Shimazuella kribbensis]|uniref:response regulator transcription factor n=1 Tax=Shimazuella kribbensis TaxID=139808 RepID=UPI0003FFC25A|nr:response regulator transcription factor [Shimazuella kribbensis]
MSKNILIVDDDKEIVNLIDISVKNEGFTTYLASNGKEALQLMNSYTIHLIILDIMMPEMDGLEFCQKVRLESSIPILMLSAKVEDWDKITGLMTGADDYMTKPFNALELIVRVKALIRRTYYLNQQVYEKKEIIRLGSLEINKSKYIASFNNVKMKLTSKEFEILFLLASHKGQIFSSEDIFQMIWKEKYYETNNTVMVHISNLREKLEKTMGYKCIHTVWGVGYKIEG